MFDGVVRTLTGVLDVPSMNRRLIFIDTLDKVLASLVKVEL